MPISWPGTVTYSHTKRFRMGWKKMALKRLAMADIA
jgi:hypothetical protein